MTAPAIFVFPLLPVLWVCLVLLLLLLVVAVVLLLRQAGKATRKADSKEQPAETEDVPAELPSVFSGAIQMLRTRVPGRDFRYRLPWFLLLGRPDSGKSTLLSESGLASALEEQVEIQQGTGLSWNFFGDGIVIDVGGWCFSSAREAVSAWRRLLWLLVNHRPEKPLDGLIVTIPATDLIGPTALSPAMLIEHGAVLNQRLRQITQRTGFHLPVYFVLTKCDAIEGFCEFANELEPDELEQIFGWSNPRSQEADFDPAWVDEAIDSMRITLERVQSRLFALHEYNEKRGAMFLFPGNLYDLIPAARLVLSRALRSGSDTPAPSFRGMYCCGSVRGVEWGQSAGTRLVPVSVPGAQAAAQHSGAAAGFGDNSTLSWVPRMMEPWLHSGLQIAFVHDLFLKKIFVEKGLATPLSHHFAVRDRTRLSLQIASAAAVIVLATGSALAYRRISEDRSQLVPLLARITTDLQSPPVIGAALPAGQADSVAGNLIHAMAGFETTGFHSAFIPVSWFTDINTSIEQAMVPAFKILVLERFYKELQLRTSQIADLSRPPLPDAVLPATDPSGTVSTNLERLPEYLQMQAFIDQVGTLQKYVGVYNQISRNNSSAPLRAIIDLDAYLHGRTSSISVGEASNPYFQQAVHEAVWTPYSYSNDVLHQVSAKTQQLATALYSAWIENNPARTATNRLVSNLNVLATPSASKYKDLVAAQQSFRIAQTTYASPSLSWVGASEFHMPADLVNVTTGPMSGSPFFEPWLHDWMLDLADQDFRNLVDALNRAQTQLTGSVVEADTGKLVLSDNAQDVQLALDNLLNLPFVSPTQQMGTITTPSRQETILWNKASLDAAATLPISYQRYLSEDIGQAPVALRKTFGKIAADRLSMSMEGAVADSEQLEPIASGANANDAVFQQAQSFGLAAGSLENLLGKLQLYNFSAPFSRLRTATASQASGLLQELNRSFDVDQPYGISTVLFNRWTGDQSATAQLFDAPTADTLAAYLSAQRDRVRTYSAAVAPLEQFLVGYRTGLTPATLHALTRWQGIDAAFREYDAKHPGNSIQSLEDYIATGLDKVQPAQSCMEAKTVAASVEKSDYFTALRGQLRRDLYLRCEVLLNESVTHTYAAIEARFNRDLAGRFPFASVSAPTLYEADPQTVAALYRQYDTASDLLHTGILPSDANQPVLSFLTELSSGRPWFTSLLSTAAAGETPSLDITPVFRVNRDEESGGNQIIDWALQVGTDTFHVTDAERKGHWNYGDPVVLTLRWAKDAPFIPVSLPDSAKSIVTPQVNGDMVTYSFKDSWSLLRFVGAFGVAGATPDTAPFTLQFNIPEAAASPAVAKSPSKQVTEAKVFIRLLITPPEAKQAITQAVLPVKAPALVVSQANAGGAQ